ncbi:MAG: hypothetical protein K2Q01_01290 [Rickettsiales bacterium]|nr:hypothetical protein [Rickettsiales bacterium]
MSAFFAILMTFLELAATALAYVTHNEPLFSDMVLNGSPLYLIMNIFNPGSPIIDGKPIYLAFLIFHMLKYVFIVRARIVDEHPGMTMSAIALEAIYLAICGYYIT